MSTRGPFSTIFIQIYNKIRTKSSSKVSKFLQSLGLAGCTKNLPFFLSFPIWKLFHFSIWRSCLLPGHSVIFTSCRLYFPYVVEYWAPTRMLLLLGNIVIVLTNHSNTDKIVFILLPDCQSYFNFLNLLWALLNSQRIKKDPQIYSTQPK